MKDFLHNINRVRFPKEKTYTLKQLQKILDGFDMSERQVTAQGLLRYLESEEK